MIQDVLPHVNPSKLFHAGFAQQNLVYFLSRMYLNDFPGVTGLLRKRRCEK